MKAAEQFLLQPDLGDCIFYLAITECITDSKLTTCSQRYFVQTMANSLGEALHK